MKKLSLILLLSLICYFSFGQFPSTSQNGSPTTYVKTKGAYGSDSGYVYAHFFTDTAAANHSFIKGQAGLTIITQDYKMWVRNFTVNQWVAIGASSPQGIQSVLDYNNYLNRNDSIKADGNSLTIDSVGTFKVNALNGVVLGFNSTALGSNATALGILVTASGSRSTAFGLSTTASGLASIAGGANTTAGNNYSVGLGHGSNSNGIGSYAFAEFSNAADNNSVVLGSRDTVTSGKASMLIGSGLSTTIDSTIKIGFKNSSTANHTIGISVTNNLAYGDPTKVLSLDAQGNLQSVTSGTGGSPTLQDAYDNGHRQNKDWLFSAAGFNHTIDSVDTYLLKSILGIDLINATSNGNITFNGIADVTGSPTLSISNIGGLSSKSTSSDQNVYLPRIHTGSGNDIVDVSIDSANLVLNHYPDTLTDNFSVLGRDIATGKIGVITGSSPDSSLYATTTALNDSIAANSFYKHDGVITDNLRTVTGDELYFKTNEVYFDHQTFSDTTWANTSYHYNLFLDNELWTGAVGAFKVYDSVSNQQYMAATLEDFTLQSVANGGNQYAYINANSIQLNNATNSRTYLQADGHDQGFITKNTNTNNNVLQVGIYGDSYLFGDVNNDGSVVGNTLSIASDGTVGLYSTNTGQTSFIQRFGITAASDIANAYFLDSKVGIGTSTPTESLEIATGNVKITTGGLILPTYANLDLSSGNYTATTAGYYEITTGDLVNAFILPDATTFNGQQITVVNASAIITPVTNSTFITSLPANSVTVYSAIGGLWYGK